MPARRRLAAASALLAASSASSAAIATNAADKVRCTAAYEQSQELRRHDALSAARSQLVICEQACPRALAADCTKWEAEVEALMPTVRLRATDGQGHSVDARVLVDGTLLVERIGDASIAVDSGDHTFRFESASGLTSEVRVSLHGGERDRTIEAVLAPARAAEPAAHASEGRPFPTPTYVLGAVGVVGVGLALALTTWGHLDAGHLASTCAPRCAPGDVDSIRTAYDVGWVIGGIGVVSLAVALVLWKPWEERPAPTSGGLFVLPTVGGGAALGWTFR
jgi:hypothetical protein